VRNVSFELRRGECLGLIGHNGAGNQAAGQPLGRLPQGSPKGEMSGSERINTTLLKMLNGLIKPDRGSITMRGRVASWSMQKTPQANGAPLHSLPATLYSSQRRRRPLGLTKKEPERRAAQRTESLGRLKEEQPKVGPKGAASGTMQVNGCRRQARRALWVGRTANQIDAKIDEIIDFA
jgi:energy-coupling factor transporter ATP-binding protein EcfA2